MLAEGIKGGFAMLYDTLSNLETLGVCRRGYFIEGMGGAQFALPGAVERLRASGGAAPGAHAVSPPSAAPSERTLVLAAADPAQPYGAALAWPKRESQDRRPARVAGAYVVLVEDEPLLYVERGGRGLVTPMRRHGPPAAPRHRRSAASRIRCTRRCRRWPTPSAPGACRSSRWSGSTASPRSPRAWPRCSWSSASIRARAASR